MKPIREKLSPVGLALYATGASRFYHDGDTAGFVWRWWHPLSWIAAPTLLVISAFMFGVPAAWRDRHLIGLRMNPWFVQHPDRLQWE